MTEFVKDILKNFHKYVPDISKPVIVQGPPEYNDGSELFSFYQKSRIYWANIPPTIESILGGFHNVHDIDIQASKDFLMTLPNLDNSYALDCGAGIGRVTKSLLTHLFDKVDCLERDFKFVTYMKDTMKESSYSNVEFLYNMSLQDFSPQEGKYSLIWCQWILEYLKETDLVLFLSRARLGLAPNGYLVIKENFLNKHTRFNKKDNSYTRTLNKYLSLLDRTGFKVKCQTKQKDYPKNLCPVIMIAATPKKTYV